MRSKKISVPSKAWPRRQQTRYIYTQRRRDRHEKEREKKINVQDPVEELCPTVRWGYRRRRKRGLGGEREGGREG